MKTHALLLLIAGISGWMKCLKSLKWGSFVGQTLTKVEPNKVNWVVKFVTEIHQEVHQKIRLCKNFSLINPSPTNALLMSKPGK